MNTLFKDFFKKQKAKAKLIQAFRSGELYLTFSKGSTTRYIMPKIHDVDIDQEKKRLRYVFSIPLGLDPKEVFKKEWLFKQQFGKNIHLENDNKVFTLSIFVQSLKQFNYSYEALLPLLEGKKLPIVAGKNVNGEMIVYDMLKAPHLLIAGETDSGKSTEVRAILTTLIKYCDPSTLRLYLGDMKRSEFHLFRNIKHVEGVYTKAFELESALFDIKKDLEDRGDILDQYGLVHIDDYNKSKQANHKIPYKIVCIDEVALLQKERAIMEIVEDISAIGRALGIFLILSMQRPDAKVLEGKLKNNLKVRMGFKHSNAINSRITDTPGAEKIKLEDQGRMILKLHDLEEVQAPYLSDKKAKELLEPYKVIKPKNIEKPPLNVNNNTLNDEDQVKQKLKQVFGGFQDEETR